jgi:hypothetical protein
MVQVLKNPPLCSSTFVLTASLAAAASKIILMAASAQGQSLSAIVLTLVRGLQRDVVYLG